MRFLRACLVISTLIVLLPAGAIGDNTESFTTSYNSFQGHSRAMVIEGEINIIDSIELVLTISPVKQSMMNHDMMAKYHNEMKVIVSKLVEFEDLTSDGFTDDDLILSTFNLNNDELKEVEVIELNGITTFIIKSKVPDVIDIAIEVNKYEDIPVAFKWSYEMQYPFASNRSNLAIIHSLEQNTQTMMDMMNNNHMGQSNLIMSDNHEFLPMQFSWDNLAKIDSIDTEISVDVINDQFVLSFPFGNQISYDPRIQLDPSDISDIDRILSDLIGINLDLLRPQQHAILMGFVGIFAIFITGLILEKRNKISF